MNTSENNNLWKRKNILITGVCGTVGSELLNQLSNMELGNICGIDNDETGLFFLDQQYASSCNIEFFLCDLRDKNGLNRVFRGVDICTPCSCS